MEPVRQALIVATDTFEDLKLRSLRAPARDAEELARVLGDPEIGDFAVQVSLNEPDNVVRRKLSEFFRERGRDDLLLLHVSSHGLKDEDGTLYFATTNTDVDHLEATAIPSEFVNRQMTRSRSHRMVLLLDCCFGGAFARGFVHRGGQGVDVAEKFDGRGRVVLTASRAMEWAFEGEQLAGEARPSIFTASIVDGLETGRADRDQDSRISVDELYDYVYDQVRETTPNQTPSKWTFDVQGELFLARSSYRAEIEPAELPLELRTAIESPFAHVRAGAVEELVRLLRGPHPGFALSARLVLEQLVEDDSRLVAEAAARKLEPEPGHQEPSPVADSAPVIEPAARKVEPEPELAAPAADSVPAIEAPAEERKPERAPIPFAAVARAPELRPPSAAALARRLSTPLALIGAAALALGYFVDVDIGLNESQWHFALKFLDPYYQSAIWFVWSPIEAFGVALLAAGVVLAGKVVVLAQEAVNGVLIGIGLLSVAGSLALLRAYDPSPALVLTFLGALAILGAGVLGAATSRPAGLDEGPRWALRAAGIGAFLLLATLVLDVAAESGGYSGPYPNSAGLGHVAEMGYQFWLELAVAAGIAAVATALAYRLPRARLLAGGLLIGVGAQAALHISGLLFQLVKFDRNLEHTWRFGGVVGLLGAGLLLAAGCAVLRASQAPSPQLEPISSGDR